MSHDIRDYYKQLETRKLESSEPEAPRSGMYKEELDGKNNPASKIMYLGEQERDLQARTQQLDTLMNRAKTGLSGAMDEIMEKFGKEEPSVFMVKLPPSMVKDGQYVDETGVAHEKFGAKQIENERQMVQLEKDVKKAEAYFPEVKLSEIEDREGKRIAIVTGADAREFNAVMRAERERVQMDEQAVQLAAEKKNVLGSMGLNTEVAVSGGGESKAATFAIAPAAAKSREPELA